jgi:hypothetical protein
LIKNCAGIEAGSFFFIDINDKGPSLICTVSLQMATFLHRLNLIDVTLSAQVGDRSVGIVRLRTQTMEFFFNQTSGNVAVLSIPDFMKQSPSC